MIQKYSFFNEDIIEFDDTRSVKELIQYAFEQFDYYEPAGMEISSDLRILIIISVVRIYFLKCKYHVQQVDVPVYFALKKRLMVRLKFARHFLGMMLFSECSVKAALRSVCLILPKKTPGCS